VVRVGETWRIQSAEAGGTIVVDRESGELSDGALAEAKRELRRTLERRGRGEPQYGHLVSRTLYRRSKSRPMTLPVVTEL
jgi:hypothetical protein